MARGQTDVAPMSTGSWIPVTHRAASEASQTTAFAMSSGSASVGEGRIEPNDPTYVGFASRRVATSGS